MRSLFGSPLNLLLAAAPLGLSCFIGRLGKSQTFHRTAATNLAAMLFLAVVALVVPAVFDLSLYGTLRAHPRESIGSACGARLS